MPVSDVLQVQLSVALKIIRWKLRHSAVPVPAIKLPGLNASVWDPK